MSAMKYPNARIFLFVLPLVLIAGCTSLPDIFPGQDIIKVSPETQEEGFRDVLVIKEIDTIPKSPVLAGQTFLLSFIIENRDKEKEAKNVIVDLFDAPLFKHKKDSTPFSEKLCNGARNTCVAEGCTSEQDCVISPILPGEQRQINFELVAPNDTAIASLQTDQDINFRVNYAFSGSTLFKVVVVNLEEIKARQRAGSPITLDILKSLGSGPIKIDAELKGAPYILSGFGGTLAFTVKSAGDTSKGSIQNSVVPANGLIVEFPLDLFGAKENLAPPSDEFTCSEGTLIKCTNTGKTLTLFKGETSPLLFRIIKSTEILKTQKIPFRSFDVKASITYTYELRDSTKVTILPVAKIR